MIQTEPLKTDLELVNNIKSNNPSASDSVSELLNRHAPLYNKVVSSMVSGVLHENLMNDKYVVLYEAARKYNTDKNTKFSTWFAEITRYHTLNYLTDLKKHSVLSPLEDNFENTHHYETKMFENEREKCIFEKLDKLKDKRIPRIFRLRFNKNMQWAQVAKELKLSVVSCINLYNRGKKMLKENLDLQSQMR